MKPKRVQRRRGIKGAGCHGAVYVGRPTKWGNPYPVVAGNNTEAVAKFRAYLAEHPELVEAARKELRGRDLCCWCDLNSPCHADVLLAAANEGA